MQVNIDNNEVNIDSNEANININEVNIDSNEINEQKWLSFIKLPFLGKIAKISCTVIVFSIIGNSIWNQSTKEDEGNLMENIEEDDFYKLDKDFGPPRQYIHPYVRKFVHPESKRLATAEAERFVPSEPKKTIFSHNINERNLKYNPMRDFSVDEDDCIIGETLDIIPLLKSVAYHVFMEKLDLIKNTGNDLFIEMITLMKLTTNDLFIEMFALMRLDYNYFFKLDDSTE